MKGHEIAENLRHTDIPWGTGRFFYKNWEGKVTYCMLGIKAKEAGATDAQLLEADLRSMYPAEGNLPTASWKVNDAWGIEGDKTKEAAIERFDSPEYRDVDFPIEPWIQKVLKLKPR